MNLSVKFSGLVLTSALFLFSCKKDVNNISLKEPQLGVFFNDSLEIETEVVLLDSLQSSGGPDMPNSAMLVGSYNDKTFGNVKAESFVNILKKSTDNIEGATVRSGSISVLSTYSYGGSSSEFSIHETKRVIKERKYYTNDTTVVGFNEPELAKLKKQNASLSDGSILYKSELPVEFCQSLFSQAGKGIVIRQASENGGISRFAANNDSTYISIKYTLPNNSEVKDFRFKLGSDSTKFYKIETDFSVSNTLSQIKPRTPISSTVLGNKAYVQAGTGLMMKIKIKDLKAFANKLGPTAFISSAELVLPYDNSIEESLFDKPQLALLYPRNGKYQLTGKITDFLHENKQGVNPVPAVPNENVYRFVLTNYLKSIIKGAKPYDELLVFPFDNTNTFTLNRVVFNTNTGQSKPFKLNIYYTK